MKKYAIVDDGEMAGDSYYSLGSCVPYHDGMSLDDIKQAFKNKIANDYGQEEAEEYADAVKVAWILDEKTYHALGNSIPNCYNDTQAYTANHTLKLIAMNLSLKIVE